MRRGNLLARCEWVNGRKVLDLIILLAACASAEDACGWSQTATVISPSAHILTPRGHE